jgi:2-polyprenyl-6-methoxyphenol hydroxylase-like FAD-dependent oxidoreductase
MVREFDLVIGAGGLHSGVRQIVFGNEGRFEKYLGYKVAAFEVQGYTPRDESTYLMHTEVGQQVSRFSMRDDRTMILFIFTDRDPNGANDIEQQKALLRERFGRSGWECPKIIQALDATDELYFDRVSQIRMGGGTSWSRGRVSLVGDAAFCVSFLAGQGSALAMVAAYILAGELYRARGNYQSAFRRYQEIIGPFVLKKQDAAIGFASAFAPRSKVAMFARNHIMNLLRIPWIADLAMGRDFNDRIPLPEY